MENTYAETLKGLLARLPQTVEVPSNVGANDRETPVPQNLRRFARETVRGEMLCQIGGVLPSVPRRLEISKVVSLDVSRGGFCFLMNKQLYPGEEVLLWTQIGSIPCVVVRCLQFNDQCYTIGVEVRMKPRPMKGNVETRLLSAPAAGSRS